MQTLEVPGVRTAFHPKQITKSSPIIFGIVNFFKGPTGPDTPHGKKYLPERGLRFCAN